MPGVLTENFEETRLGRSRFLGLIGGGLFAFATRMFVASPALAEHTGPPFPCFAYPECHCCNGATCCSGGCVDQGNAWGCPSGFQCWRTCVNTILYRCCDWGNPAGQVNVCICRSIIGSCDPCEVQGVVCTP